MNKSQTKLNNKLMTELQELFDKYNTTEFNGAMYQFPFMGLDLPMAFLDRLERDMGDGIRMSKNTGYLIGYKRLIQAYANNLDLLGNGGINKFREAVENEWLKSIGN